MLNIDKHPALHNPAYYSLRSQALTGTGEADGLLQFEYIHCTDKTPLSATWPSPSTTITVVVAALVREELGVN